MVMTSAEYHGDSENPRIVKIGVFDPWPGKGSRGLHADEMTPIFQGGSLRFVGLPQIYDL